MSGRPAETPGSIRPVSAQSTAAPRLAASRSRGTTFLEDNGTLVMVIGAFAMVMLVALRRGLVDDGWLALLAGRQIAQHGLPSHEVLTLWGHGRDWVDQQWLAQLTLYGLQRVGGVKLVLLVHTVLAVGSLVGAAALARRIGGSPRSTTWVAIPLMIAYYQIAGVMRTQSFAFPLLVAVLWLLVTDSRAPSRRVFATLPLLVLWANLHGSVILGAALVSLAGVVGLADALRQPPRRVPARAVALMVAPWACVLASPYAAGLPGYYHTVLTGGDFSRFITEWAATKLSVSTAPVYLFAFGGAWLLGRAGQRATTFEKAAFVLTGLLALQTLRNMAWFALVALAVLPVVLDGVRSPAYEPRRLNRLLAIGIAATTLVTVVAVAAKPESWFTSRFPAAAGEAAANAAGPHGKILATVPYADWLLWSHPELGGRVAFDARFELLTKAELKRVADFQAQAADWQATARGYRVLVLGTTSDRALRLALVRDGIARVVHRDATVTVLRTS
jgi:hypothetical protein